MISVVCKRANQQVLSRSITKIFRPISRPVTKLPGAVHHVTSNSSDQPQSLIFAATFTSADTPLTHPVPRPPLKSSLTSHPVHFTLSYKQLQVPMPLYPTGALIVLSGGIAFKRTRTSIYVISSNLAWHAVGYSSAVTPTSSSTNLCLVSTKRYQRLPCLPYANSGLLTVHSHPTRSPLGMIRLVHLQIVYILSGKSHVESVNRHC